MVLFADSEWVVRSVELGGSLGGTSFNKKTELSFYNTKTCRLAALVSVPNRVFEVGRIGDTRGGPFYVGTITPAKYMYEDCPLAITLVDLETESIERIPVISDDYWLALGHELGIQASAGSLRFTVDKGTLSQYVRTQPEKEVFKGIRISFVERSRSSDGTDRWADDESGSKKHRDLLSRERSGLAELGPRPARISVGPALAARDSIWAASAAASSRSRYEMADSIRVTASAISGGGAPPAGLSSFIAGRATSLATIRFGWIPWCLYRS
jgi:hypothetical protein